MTSRRGCTGPRLSISRCGYNTATALLRSHVPSVIVPATNVVDQRYRAERFARAGLAVAVDGDDAADVAVLTAAIETALATPPTPHDLNLDGAAGTRRFIEELATTR